MHPGARIQLGPPSRSPTLEPRLGFGAWAVGGDGWGTPPDERDRIAAVERAVERGITWFDTAPAYGDGASETLLGRALKPHRQHVVIGTKVGPAAEPRASLEASLRRLACDYVDLVQLHETLGRWEWQLEQLHTLQQQGKALAIGLCNATHLQIARALEIAPVVTYQGPYSLLDRDVEQRELPLCRARALGFIAYRPLASGLLTGKYATPPQFAEGDHRRKIYWFRGAEFERRRRVIDRLRPIAARRGTPLTAIALGWVLARAGVSIVLAGARDARQLDDNVTALERPLTPHEVTAIDEIVAAVFRPARASEQARALSANWGARERFIVERLDGKTSCEAIAADWTDRGEQPMIAAQVKVFADELRERSLVEVAS